MQLEAIIPELSFIEYATSVNKANINSIEFTTPIDAIRLGKLLNNNQKIPLWLDYGEITPIALNYPKQLDLLGHSDEPVVIIKSSNEDEFYLFKLKRFTDSADMFYGRDQKHLIEKCLIIWLANFVNSAKFKNDQFDKYFQVCKNQLLKIGYLNDELIVVKKQSEMHLTSLFKFILKDEILPNQTLSLSDTTISYLNEANFDIETLSLMATEAYKTANALNPHSTEIRIKRYFFPELKLEPVTTPRDIQNQVNKKGIQKERDNPVQRIKPKITLTKLQKTIGLLDRYEDAVLKLMNAKLPIMGKNIANFCTPPISAPALTDSINKHAHRIKECLVLSPEKWPNLRLKYLPIQKLD